MKTALEIENKASLNGASDLLSRLEETLSNSKPPIKEWLVTQIESSLSEIPFKEASLKPPLAPVRELAPNRLLNPQEAAKLLNVPVRWLYRHSKKLPCCRLGKLLRFPERELLKWADRSRR